MINFAGVSLLGSQYEATQDGVAARQTDTRRQVVEVAPQMAGEALGQVRRMRPLTPPARPVPFQSGGYTWQAIGDPPVRIEAVSPSPNDAWMEGYPPP